MSDTHFPKASAELAQLLGVPGKEAEIGEFLARFGVRAVQGFISFMPASWSNEEILEGMRDTYSQHEIMKYNLSEEEEEDEEDE